MFARQSHPWLLYVAELIGTALLVGVGLSFVILDFGQGSPMIQFIPSEGWRRLITGFLFGSTGALITLSPLGKESGAHINPVVTLAFWLTGKLRTRHVIGYMLAQITGAALGAVPLLAWGEMGRSIAFGATQPGAAYGAGWALIGETATTFSLIFGLFFFLQHHRLRAFTPLLFPFFVCSHGVHRGGYLRNQYQSSTQLRACSNLRLLACLVDILVGSTARHVIRSGRISTHWPPLVEDRCRKALPL